MTVMTSQISKRVLPCTVPGCVDQKHRSRCSFVTSLTCVAIIVQVNAVPKSANSLLTRLSKKDEHMFNVWPFSQRTCRHECRSAGLYVRGVEPQARTRTQLQRRSYSVVRLTGPVRSVVGEWSGVWH